MGMRPTFRLRGNGHDYPYKLAMRTVTTYATAIFPLVPGHEIAGLVIEVGSQVTKHSVGDRVGVGRVGCMVDSCRTCENCVAGEEQYCVNGNSGTYNRIARTARPTTETQQMLDFCAAHGIGAALELSAGQIDEAYDRVVNSDVRHRFVIDAASFLIESDPE